MAAPEAPTNVLATDGGYVNKVTITWTKSDGADAYHILRDTVDIKTLGDVATWDDETGETGKVYSYAVVAYTGEDASAASTANTGWARSGNLPAQTSMPQNPDDLINSIINNLHDTDLPAIKASTDILGALDTAAATGAVTDSDLIMAYVKQLVTNSEALVGSTNRLATKASATPLTTGNLFTFTGTIGFFITGRITKVHPAAANTCKLSIVSDALGAYDICATKDLTGLNVGTLLSITGTAADALVATDGVPAIAPGQANMVEATCTTSGVIKVTFGDSGNQDSAITWNIKWIPLSAGATLVAA